ncbi:TrkH family potassium uptake protein [Parasphaerochaeta coccoides]|uniref:Cation transporter n=1 Tax=Parasphaerochaeta coccoides (strain ATCC BAA-1237 / DSM 17374 / SPN1) TaxID=760011 RepID=F4GL50_PARC1|nr:TrkH family potassium uptake protein [Parasphaerochaeta coccoides]AEC02390.1 cation transporter [Parasphaerochaeta coccoides DSM 17374]
MLNWKQDARLLSSILMVFTLVMSIPTAIAWSSREHDAFRGFLWAMFTALVLAALLYHISLSASSRKLGTRDGYILVTTTWLLVTAIGAIPLRASGAFPTYTAAYFEIMSGFSTTGASVIPVHDAIPSSIHFWRSATNWLGGMGIIVLFVALVPVMGSGGAKLVGAEFVGPTKDKLTPKIRNTALSLWLIYVGLSVLQAILLLAGGIPLYDAATITFSTMSAAGFSPYAGGVSFFSSRYVLVIVIIFMFLSGVNFALFFKALMGQGKLAIRDKELRTYGIITLVVATAGGISLAFSGMYDIGESFFQSLFQTVSFISTTGFVTADYQTWPAFNQMLLFILIFIGGCAGSAAGGIKVMRIMTMARLAKVHMRQRLHPNGVFPVHVGTKILSPEVTRGVSAYFGIYFTTALAGILVISLTGVDFETAVSSVLTCLSNVGIGFGQVGPKGSFAMFPPWAHWVFSFLILAGRLEFFTVFTVFTRDFWKR